jgi:tetratricopeptide (TPR) repeat protein
VDLLRDRTLLAVAALLVTIPILAGACAHGGREEAPPDRAREMGPRETAAGEREGADTSRDAGGDEEAEAPGREIDEDRTLAFDTGAGTPQRQASLRVVEEGKGYLIAGRAREAAQRFTRATQIDPTNGFAYYYLGRARIAAGDRRGAVGVLQKAESLLGPYSEWLEATRSLLDSLGAS